jgi:hypothetical protein
LRLDPTRIDVVNESPGIFEKGYSVTFAYDLNAPSNAKQQLKPEDNSNRGKWARLACHPNKCENFAKRNMKNEIDIDSLDML